MMSPQKFTSADVTCEFMDGRRQTVHGIAAQDWLIEKTARPYGSFWRVVHIPSAQFLPVNSFTFNRLKDAKSLVSAIIATGIQFSSAADLESRPEHRAAILETITTRKP